MCCAVNQDSFGNTGRSLVPGVQHADRFVAFGGQLYAGLSEFCAVCVTKSKPQLRQTLANVQKTFTAGKYTKFGSKPI